MFVLFVCGLSLIPQRERKSVWQIVSNEKCLYTCIHNVYTMYTCIHVYTHLITSPALNDRLWVHNFRNSCSQNVTDTAQRKRLSKYDRTINDTKFTNYSVTSGFSVLRHPNHILLAGANNSKRYHYPPIPRGPCLSKSRFFLGY